MASPFDRLMETIRPHLPGALDSAIRQELFAICEDFFSQTNTWKEAVTFTLAADKKEAEVMPFGGKLVRLISVTKNDVPVRGVILTDPIQGVVLFPTSDPSPGDYVALVSITVADPISRDAFPIVPVDLVTRFWKELMEGTIASMMAQPSKPYSNPSLGAYHLSKYRGGTARARNMEQAGNTKNSQSWAFPQSFNRRRTQ